MPSPRVHLNSPCRRGPLIIELKSLRKSALRQPSAVRYVKAPIRSASHCNQSHGRTKYSYAIRVR